MTTPFSFLTISDIWSSLLGVKDKTLLDDHELMKTLEWPPDVFCLTAAVLRRSSVYTRVSGAGIDHELIKRAGERWRENITQGSRKAPGEVEELWREVLNGRTFFITEWTETNLQDRKGSLLSILGSLFAIADEACCGFGMPTYTEMIHYQADAVLEPSHFGSTLCKRIHPERARVLPKTHTPRSGFTLRSMSHHLCYIEAGEGRPLWYTIPSGPVDVSRLNILLVPWPFEISGNQFRESATHGGDGNKRSASFDFDPEETCGILAMKISRLCAAAERQCGKVDVVILPELAVAPCDYRLLRRWLLSRGITLVAGIGGRTQEGLRENRIGLDIPVSLSHAVHLRQRKHHPWRLDERQIRQYGLFNNLSPAKTYWEHLQIGDRHLCFVALHPRLLASILICEDLAQYEPVGKLVRAVGPNLVIALLMDGPQTLERWSHRYAGVLADDPGSSVLAITSRGMSCRSQPQRGHSSRSRVVALWKDIKTTQEFEITDSAHGILLTLDMHQTEEWTADMRDYPAYNPILLGYSPIVDDGNQPNPQWFDERTEPPDIRFIAPIEAAALAQLTRLTFAYQNASSDAAKSDTLRYLSKEYAKILARLDQEARRIAYQILGQSVVPTLSSNPPRMADQYRIQTLGTEEKCQRLGLEQFGIAWGHEVEDDPDIAQTATSILAWRKRAAKDASQRKSARQKVNDSPKTSHGYR